MKGLKIFGWISFVLSALCLLESHFDLLLRLDYHLLWRCELPWKDAALIFLLASILSWLLIRALKQIKEELELKIIMNT